MRSIHIYHNAHTKGRRFFMKGRLPVRQTLIFIGPFLIRVAPKEGK